MFRSASCESLNSPVFVFLVSSVLKHFFILVEQSLPLFEKSKSSFLFKLNKKKDYKDQKHTVPTYYDYLNVYVYLLFLFSSTFLPKSTTSKSSHFCRGLLASLSNTHIPCNTPENGLSKYESQGSSCQIGMSPVEQQWSSQDLPLKEIRYSSQIS